MFGFSTRGMVASLSRTGAREHKNQSTLDTTIRPQQALLTTQIPDNTDSANIETNQLARTIIRCLPGINSYRKKKRIILAKVKSVSCNSGHKVALQRNAVTAFRQIFNKQ